MIETSKHRERAFLVGADVRGTVPLLTVEDSLIELALLARTAGIDVVGRAIQHVKQIDSNTFIGSGKVQEIREEIERLRADTLIFDDELSPRHQRELEEAMGENVNVLDRSALILDIFAQHAQTREGALQVELAQYEYRLPRLTRQWTHLARQAGGGAARGGAAGVGLRGPGETQLEVDRREISRKISKLKVDIEDVRAQRSRHRMQRTRLGTPVVALVGYTNAGKSTLLNRLTGADVYVADKLFATLDPTTRRLELPGGKAVLVSDTVGFIQKLPTTLIAAFRATLEEVRDADMIIHVVDLAHPNAHQQIEAVEDTLAELDVPRIPRLLALNKFDLWQTLGNDRVETTEWAQGYDAVVPLSARDGSGIPELLAEIERVLIDQMIEVQALIPYSRGDMLAQVHELGVIDAETSTATGTRVQAHVPPRLAAYLTDFVEV
ncbi:MAG: GTPase HflX [Aggregatilineales bacterium]